MSVSNYEKIFLRIINRLLIFQMIQFFSKQRQVLELILVWRGYKYGRKRSAVN